MTSKRYFLVGLSTVLMTAAIVSLILWKNSIFNKVNSYELVGEFQSVNGLLEKAVVKYRGYPVGRVIKITPNPESIDVLFFIEDKHEIPVGSTVKIVFDGLVGEKYMEINPNIKGDKIMAHGDRIYGFSTPGLSDFIDVGTQNLLELQSILNTMASVFGSEEISVALKEVVFSMRDAASNMDKAISELKGITGSTEIKQILEDIQQLVNNLNSILSEKDYQKVSNTIENFEVFSQNIRDILEDQQVKNRLLSTLEETSYTFEKSSSFLNMLSRIYLLSSADFSYNNNMSGIMYELNFDFWLDDSFLNVGFSNFSGNDQLESIQFSAPFTNDSRFRYGLIRSFPGMGFDYYFQGMPLISSISMYRFSEPLIDIELTYFLLDHLSLKTGYEKLNNDERSWSLGISINPDDND